MQRPMHSNDGRRTAGCITAMLSYNADHEWMTTSVGTYDISNITDDEGARMHGSLYGLDRHLLNTQSTRVPVAEVDPGRIESSVPPSQLPTHCANTLDRSSAARLFAPPSFDCGANGNVGAQRLVLQHLVRHGTSAVVREPSGYRLALIRVAVVGKHRVHETLLRERAVVDMSVLR